MSELKLQPQSGLGDLIQLLPTIEMAIELKINITVATNHSYVLAPYGDAVHIVPVHFKGIIPIPHKGFQQLRYNKYGTVKYSEAYFNNIFPQHDTSLYNLAVESTRKRFLTWVKDVRFCKQEMHDNEYIIFGYPHAAKRHKQSAEPFRCAPDIEYAEQRLEIYKSFLIVAVGQDDTYLNINESSINNFIDARGILTFKELLKYISNSRYVLSQAGAITTLAGLFGIPTDFLPAKSESINQHQKHITGIVWPWQGII